VIELRGGLRAAARVAALLPAVALLSVAAPPGVARAETRSFTHLETLFPAEEGKTVGAANHYPSAIDVSGVLGTVTKVSVTTVDLKSEFGDDIDMLLVGPNGVRVMLMSDTCGNSEFADEDWTFEDAAPGFLPDQAPCASGQQASFKPTNYEEPGRPDNFVPGGGPAAPYETALFLFDGSSPDGAWDLFLRDDTPNELVGFELAGWTLSLEIQPPPEPSSPAAPTTTTTAPTTTTIATPPTVTAVPPATAPPPVASAKTGKRAKALARCKTKKTTKARALCRRRARKLPV
jgi:subtilisin-like proprotein convertase family protein